MVVTKNMPVALGLGTHTWSVGEESAKKALNQILDVARKHGVKHLDTARIYVRRLPVSPLAK